MLNRIRYAMADSAPAPLGTDGGDVEVDETGIGGKDKTRHWNKKQHLTGMNGKTTVIGAISRKGNVVCQVIEKTDASPIHAVPAEPAPNEKSGGAEVVRLDRFRKK